MLTKLKTLPALATMAGAIAMAPLLAPAPAQAYGCGEYTVTELSTIFAPPTGPGTGNFIECGDKKFSDFTDIDFPAATSSAVFSDLGATHTLEWKFSTPLSGDPMTGGTTFISKYIVEVTSGETILAANGNTYTGMGGVTPDLAYIDSDPIYEFSAMIALDGGATVSSWTNTISQTPGPLPILGAGAAFGFSRKLRRRIKSVV
jgi:hypothetical protein